jgi:hypothetical protein
MEILAVTLIKGEEIVKVMGLSDEQLAVMDDDLKGNNDRMVIYEKNGVTLKVSRQRLIQASNIVAWRNKYKVKKVKAQVVSNVKNNREKEIMELVGL